MKECSWNSCKKEAVEEYPFAIHIPTFCAEHKKRVEKDGKVSL